MDNKNTLSERQLKILLMLIRNDDNYVSIDKLKNIFLVQEKSIYNDIKAINSQDFGGAIAHVFDGYKLTLFDENKKDIFLKSVQETIKYDLFSDTDIRTRTILCILLKSKGYVRSVTLQNKLFISKSTLTNDLSHVRELLDQYDLSLEVKPHYGLKVSGNELNIRRLVVQKLANLYLADKDGVVHIIHAEEISTILANVLLKYRFKVSDIVFQNLIIHIATSIQRIRSGYRLSPSKNIPLAYYHAITIAKDIFNQCDEKFELEYDEEEIKYLAIELQCKRDYDKDTSINEEIDSFVTDALSEIQKKLHINLTGDLDLRISLALHTSPLINRLQNNIQLTNALTMDVKRGFPLAYDIATQYARCLSKKYNVKLPEEEIAYLALHFINALKKQERSKSTHKVLLICEQRRTNTILIQQQLLNWFKDDISTVNIINILEVHITDTDSYDVVITTSNEILKDIPNAVLINLFPNEKDRSKIEMAFSGITKSSDVINHFHPDLFFVGDVKDKNEMITILCDKATKKYNLDFSFKESVMLHESFANTFFGNHIAMPHPDTFITDSSFIAVGIPTNSLTWDNEPNVQLVLLVSIKKNDPTALRIWQYLSFLITDDTLLRELVSNPDYDSFINLLNKFYQHLLDK